MNTMKKNLKKSLALFLCASMLAGCNNSGSNTGNDTKNKSKNTNNTKTITLINEVKQKYAGRENANYTEPLYNLEKDHVFTYENLPEEYFDLDDYDCFSVYYDSTLSNFVDINIERDYDNKSVTISPNLTFCYGEEGSYISDNWGSHSKFWLVQNVDLKTGKMLDTPLITVFTTKEEINTPTMEQSVGADGLYTLSWNPVEGADYYEVYEYSGAGAGSSFIEVTTESTSCTYNDFKTAIEYKEHFKETYKDTEIDTDDDVIYSMNEMLNNDASYFVVARTKDGKDSGMSNICEVSEIGNQIPYIISDDFPREYEGDTATALPAYAKVQMVDGSNGDFLIQYHGAKTYQYQDGRVGISCKFKNLPIWLPLLTLSGMDYHAFMEETELITKREDELVTKSVTGNENVSIPYLPDQNITFPPETETPNPDTSVETPSIDEPSPSTRDNSIEETSPVESVLIDLDEELKKSVYANSAMTEWIALNMLSHQEQIYLGDFPEYADSQKISSALLEAYNQNPLIGIMEQVDYDYATKSLQVSYVLSKEDTKKMQKESISKAKEIVSSIITDDMNDYEKEVAINQYLCENGSYNEQIFDYINEDGTIDANATKDFANSFTPYGILVENLGVCESYAESFLLLAKEAGLDAIIVTGSLDGVNHEWNRVKLEDSWYTLDVTNNDSLTVPNGYFNLSDELAENVLKENNSFLADTSPDWLKAEDNSYEYYTRNQWIAGEEDTAVNILTELLGTRDQAAVRLEGNLSETDVEKIAQSTCNKGNITKAKFYYRTGVLSIIKE